MIFIKNSNIGFLLLFDHLINIFFPFLFDLLASSIGADFLYNPVIGCSVCVTYPDDRGTER